jgi:hypothetical protein
MRTIFIRSVTALGLLTAGSVYAQQDDPVRLGKFLQTMPRPQTTLPEMMANYKGSDAVEKAFSTAYQAIHKTITYLYSPVYERFQKAAGNPGSMKLTAAEQTIMATFRQGSKGLSAAVQFDFFKMQMINRLPVGNGKPMWALTIPSPKSAFALKIYQQLKTLEAGFDWKLFNVAAENYLPKFGSVDKTIEALNKKFITDQQNIPKKQVMIFEGVKQEIEDPEKAAALWAQHGAEKQKAFARQYASVYTWWNQQYQKLAAIGGDLDALASEAGSGGEDLSTLKPFLVDLQIRTWEALERLTAVSQQLHHDSLIALASEQQVKEAIAMYRQLKVQD